MKSIVKQSKKISNKTNFLLGLFLLIIILLIAINPSKYSAVAFNGLLVWAKILVPSLLPFFILTKLFASTGVIDDIKKFFSKATQKLYNCPSESAYVFLMSILTGYPVGSKLVCELHSEGKLTTNQAIRTTSFCSNSGPMFILGSVAIGMFADKTMGFVIFASHIIGAILNGILYKNYGKKSESPMLKNNLTIQQKQFDFAGSVVSSVNSIMLIGGVICFTFVLLEAITTNCLFVGFLNLLNKIGFDSNLTNAILCGIGEITKGCLLLSKIYISKTAIYALCTFVISFGGISTFLQAYAFLKGIVPSKVFLLQKLTHAIFSTIICLLICLII